MKKILGILALVLLMSGYAYAGKFSAKEGDTVENQVSFGKDKFPLPPGKFLVAVSFDIGGVCFIKSSAAPLTNLYTLTTTGAGFTMII